MDSNFELTQIVSILSELDAMKETIKEITTVLARITIQLHEFSLSGVDQS